MYVDLHILIYNLAFTYVNGKTIYCLITQCHFIQAASWNRLLDCDAGLFSNKQWQVIKIALTAVELSMYINGRTVFTF